MGYWTAYFLENEGAKLVGVQDAYGSITNSDGIEVSKLYQYMQGNKGSIVGYDNAQVVEKDHFFELDCDICIPAALGNQITAENATKIKAFLIAEGANGPTDIS